MTYNDPISDLVAYDLNSLDNEEANLLINRYLKYILHEDRRFKIFSGIPRDYTNKYIRDFHQMLMLNESSSDELDIGLDCKSGLNYTSFFVFKDGRGHAFGSFKQAYLYACYSYFESVIIFEDDIIKDIAENVDVFFGQVIVKDDKICSKDLIPVVNKSYYGYVNDEISFE